MRVILILAIFTVASADEHKELFEKYGMKKRDTNNKAMLLLPATDTHGYQSPFAFLNRQKRHVFFSEENLRKLKNSFLEKVKLTACILQRMNILDSTLSIMWNEVERHYAELDLDSKLKADLLQVFKKCKNKVSCLPMDQNELGTFPVGLKQALKYFKCEKKYKVEACMKKDFRAHSNMLELDGLDGLFDHFEDNDDKMLKVMKIFQKFGDDDMIFSISAL